MKHPAIRKRAMPFLVLTAILMTLAVPATALLQARSETASVATFAKNGTVQDVINFSPEDFVVEGGENVKLDSILVGALPDHNAGTLMLGTVALASGDQIAATALSGLRFYPLINPTVASTCFSFMPVFSNGMAGDEVTVSLYLLTAPNNAPIAENLELVTYKNVAVTGYFSAVDPEGDLLTFRLVNKPARGSVKLGEEGEFVYTPYENKTGKDSFSYVAVDSVGNVSQPATVSIRIEKAKTKVTYADMDGVASYRAALRLAEGNVFIGERMADSYFFNPNAPVTRSEFVAMTMAVTGMEALEGVTRTGFADDAAIPTWAKPYISSALKSGIVQGSLDESGRAVFKAGDIMTRAEATVLLDRVLEISDVVTDVWYADSAATPAWAYQSAVNLETAGIIRTDASGALSLNQPLTRGDAAMMLSSAMDVLEARDTSGWFNWKIS